MVAKSTSKSAYLFFLAALVAADMVTDCVVVARWYEESYGIIGVGLLCASWAVPLFLGYVLQSECFCNFTLPLYLCYMGCFAWFAGTDGFGLLSHILFEACPQLAFQAYVATNDFFEPDKTDVPLVVAASLALSVVSLAVGLASHWLVREESTAKLCVGGVVFAAMTVARYGSFVGAFVEFGHVLWLGVVVVTIVRGVLASYMWGERQVSKVAVACLPLAIAPLGSHKADEFNSCDFNVATVAEVLHSPLGKVNITLHLLEDAVLLALAGLVPSLSHRNDVSLGFLLFFGVLPLTIGIVLYATTWYVDDAACSSAAPPRDTSSDGEQPQDDEESTTKRYSPHSSYQESLR